MRIRYKIWGIIIVIIIGLVLLFFINPEKSIWMPKCPFYLLTGWKCPACGFQRATHSLLHLNFVQAIKYNYFLALATPYAFLLVIVTWLDPKDKLKKLKQFCYSRITVYSYLFCLIAWWVLRNIANV